MAELPADDAPDVLAHLDDHSLASSLATSAGRILLDVRAQDPEGGKALGVRGDRAAQEHLAAALTAARPGDAVLSEEARDDGARLSAYRVWIIDPLDGTREFGEIGRDDWAVHVALWQDGELIAGAVALPAQGLTLRTGPGGITGVPPSPSGRPRMVVSRTRPPAEASFVAQRLGAELVPMGSAGAKVTAVARGLAEIYVHGGGQYEWDSAAPIALARQAGLHTSRLDGSPLLYNQRDVLLPDLLVCRRELADAALAALAEAGVTTP